jgi:hypothetical protein
MRTASLVLASLALPWSRAARAGLDDGSSAMTPVADVAAACTALAEDADVSPQTCKSVQHVKLAKGASADLVLHEGDFIRYAVVLTSGGASYTYGPVVDLMANDCAMQKCTSVIAPAKLRVLKGRTRVGLEITATFQIVARNDGPQEDWTQYDAVVCGVGSSGPACMTAHWGDRYSPSCTGVMSNDGNVTSTCTDSKQLFIP